LYGSAAARPFFDPIAVNEMQLMDRPTAKIHRHGNRTLISIPHRSFVSTACALDRTRHPSAEKIVAFEDVIERPGALGRDVRVDVGVFTVEGAGGEAGGGLVVGVEIGGEALADRRGEAALDLVAERSISFAQWARGASALAQRSFSRLIMICSSSDSQAWRWLRPKSSISSARCSKSSGPFQLLARSARNARACRSVQTTKSCS
jgi:hypothetical protein